MQIFSKLNVYDRKYTYDEMKVMCLIDTYHTTYNLEYEDLCCIVEAVYAHWIDGRDASEDEKYAKYPWLEFETTEEEGCIQVYAQRVLPEFIKLYKVRNLTMTNAEFKTKLTEAFKTHMFMKDRDHHTVNELLYVLEHDSRFNGEDFNISISQLNGGWSCIPCLDAFVDIGARGMWFNDADVEFEVEECDEEKYNCITVYEREEI